MRHILVRFGDDLSYLKMAKLLMKFKLFDDILIRKCLLGRIAKDFQWSLSGELLAGRKGKKRAQKSSTFAD